MLNIKTKTKTKYVKKSRVIVVLFAAVVLLYAVVLAAVTASGGGDRDGVYKYEMPIEAPRGEIVDRNGVTIVSNRRGNVIRFNAAFFPGRDKKEERNEIIKKLTALCIARKEKWVDNLPIKLKPNGEAYFEKDRQADVALLKSRNMLDLNSYATAEECLDAIFRMYSIKDTDRSSARNVASVLYEMWRTGYGVNSPYTFAKDVSDETISVIKENSAFFRGVENAVVTYSEYSDGTLAPHVIGITGGISRETYEEKTKELKKRLEDGGLDKNERKKLELNAYTMNDEIGKFGIEQAMEKQLRGSKGLAEVTVTEDGKTKITPIIKPVGGNTVELTIDSGLQSVAQNALRDRVVELRDKTGKLEAAGAVVVLDANTSEVLASATYPSYDLTKYYDDYDKLLKADGNPLIDRVLQSAYEPGSAMKPAMAIAGLEAGVIDEKTEFYCNSVFKYFDVTFTCLAAHGSLDVRHALQNSCNTYFYNVGNLLGIDTMNRYCKQLGLGEKTGVETYETKGVLAGRAYREAMGAPWFTGDTIQAAIGQSDNLFTLMQLANYCATIANGGTRNRCHFVKSVMSADRERAIEDIKTQTLEKTGFSKKNIDTVKDGMLLVATRGTGAAAFSSIPQSVAAKTGTTQVKKLINGKYVKGNNGLIITFSPFEKPEIVVCVLIENVEFGSATAKVAADIYKYYYATKVSVDRVPPAGDILY